MDKRVFFICVIYVCVMYLIYMHLYIKYIHIQMEYYSAIKKDILPFAVHHTWMNPEDTMLSEMNQTLKDDYCTVSLKCGV